MGAKKKKKKPVYMSIRRTWDRNPVTKVKQNVKAEAKKKACRGKIERPGGGMCAGIAA